MLKFTKASFSYTPLDEGKNGPKFVHAFIILYLSFGTSPEECSCFCLRLERNISFNMIPKTPTCRFINSACPFWAALWLGRVQQLSTLNQSATITQWTRPISTAHTATLASQHLSGWRDASESVAHCGSWILAHRSSNTVQWGQRSSSSSQ